MKKIFFFLLLGTMMSLQMRAQVNPKPGFIITNHGDTIRGNIDFRTNETSFGQMVLTRVIPISRATLRRSDSMKEESISLLVDSTLQANQNYTLPSLWFKE